MPEMIYENTHGGTDRPPIPSPFHQKPLFGISGAVCKIGLRIGSARHQAPFTLMYPQLYSHTHTQIPESPDPQEN